MAAPAYIVVEPVWRERGELLYTEPDGTEVYDITDGGDLFPVAFNIRLEIEPDGDAA